jgi:hypothetical protein
MYAALAVRRRGGTTHPITWELPAGTADDRVRSQVVAQAEAAIDAVMADGADVPLVIGKSLGSLAAPVVAQRGLPAVWFTPLLNDEPTLAALRRATAPCLLVGGTSDRAWDGEVAREISKHVTEVDGADHGMLVQGALAASAAALAHVITAVEEFLDQVVWPSSRPGSDPMIRAWSSRSSGPGSMPASSISTRRARR